MAIDASQRKAMAAGKTLTAKYKGTPYTVDVVAGAEGKLLYRLGDGREFKSPSAAGSAVMGGSACNGWRFWSVAGAEPAKPAATEMAAPKQTTKSERPRCEACGKSFVSAKQMEHHQANAERLCRPAA